MESQSRYSIVERLTEKKLEMMKKKTYLKDDVIKAEQTSKRLVTDAVDDKKVIQSEADQRKKDLDRAVKQAQENVTNLKARQKEKESLYDAQIKTVEDALKKLESISKLSQSN